MECLSAAAAAHVPDHVPDVIDAVRGACTCVMWRRICVGMQVVPFNPTAMDGKAYARLLDAHLSHLRLPRNNGDSAGEAGYTGEWADPTTFSLPAALKVLTHARACVRVYMRVCVCVSSPIRCQRSFAAVLCVA